MADAKQSCSKKLYNVNEALEHLLDSDVEFNDTEICMSSSEDDDDDVLDYCERQADYVVEDKVCSLLACSRVVSCNIIFLFLIAGSNETSNYTCNSYFE